MKGGNGPARLVRLTIGNLHHSYLVPAQGMSEHRRGTFHARRPIAEAHHQAGGLFEPVLAKAR